VHNVETGPKPGRDTRGAPYQCIVAERTANARAHARTKATLNTTGPTFASFLLGVILIVGGLIYFPMLILGPIGERLVG
jgi:K+-transporting ATPase A subunit